MCINVTEQRVQNYASPRERLIGDLPKNPLFESILSEVQGTRGGLAKGFSNTQGCLSPT